MSRRSGPAIVIDIPAATDAPTLDQWLAKISAMALDLLPDPGVDPASVVI